MRREVVNVMRRFECQVTWRWSWRFGSPFGGGGGGSCSTWDCDGSVFALSVEGIMREDSRRSNGGVIGVENGVVGLGLRYKGELGHEVDAGPKFTRLGRPIPAFQISIGECGDVGADVSAGPPRP